MTRRLATPARTLTLGVLAAALLLAAGCGGDAKKLVGTWQLDTRMTGEKAQDYAVTMTFASDGTGTINSTYPVPPDMTAPPPQKFDWEIEGEQLVMSIPDAGTPQKMGYEFQKDGTLSLSAGQQPPMKLTRVQ
jgi:hypothetical protein